MSRLVELYVVSVVHIGWLVSILYLLFYRRSPWRDYVTGPALMWKALSLCALFTISIVGFWWPFPGYQYVYAGGVTLVVGAMAYQFHVLRRLQRGPHPDF